MTIRVFENAATIKTQGWLRLVTGLEVYGGLMPDGYGVAWHLPHLAAVVCAPVPWNLPLGWAYRLYWRLRASSSAGKDALSRAYQAGLTFEREQTRATIRRLEYETGRAYRHGKEDARAELFGELHSLVDQQFPRGRTE